MNEIFYEFAVNNAKAEHAFESAFDSYVISVIDLVNKNKSGVITESSELEFMLIEESNKFVESIEGFFKNMADNANQVVKKTQDKIHGIIEKKNVVSQIKSIKKNMPKDKTEMPIFDVAKYSKAYGDFVNFATGEMKKLFSATYEDVESFDNALNACKDSFEKKWNDLKLDSDDEFVVKADLSKAVTFVEKEVLSAKNSAASMHKSGLDVISSIRGMAKGESDSVKIKGMRVMASTLASYFAKSYQKVINESGKVLNKVLAVAPKKSEKEKVYSQQNLNESFFLTEKSLNNNELKKYVDECSKELYKYIKTNSDDREWYKDFLDENKSVPRFSHIEKNSDIPQIYLSFNKDTFHDNILFYQDELIKLLNKRPELRKYKFHTEDYPGIFYDEK